MKTQVQGQKSAKTFHSTIVLMFLIGKTIYKQNTGEKKKRFYKIQTPS